MSDDRDPDQGNGAPVGRPQRPTGKRTRQRAGGTALAEIDLSEDGLTEQFEALDDDDDGKPVKAKKTDAGSSRNPILFVWTYLRQVVAEMRKVIWPNRKEMVTYTLVVLAFLVFMVTLIGAMEIGLAKLVLWIFG